MLCIYAMRGDGAGLILMFGQWHGAALKPQAITGQ